MFVYRLSDLDALYAQMREFWWAIFYFNGYLREPNHSGRIDEFRRLREFPQVRQAILELAVKVHVISALNDQFDEQTTSDLPYLSIAPARRSLQR